MESYAVRIDYTTNSLNGCGRQTVPLTCSSEPTTPANFLIATGCTDAPPTNPYIDASWLQVQSFATSGSGCSGNVVGGTQLPYHRCAPVPNTASFTRISAEPVNGTMFISTFSDSKCTSRVNTTEFGNLKAAACLNDVLIKPINYAGYAVVTTYSDANCKVPAKLQYLPSIQTPCTPSTICSQNNNQEFITTTCDKTYNLAATSKYVFGPTTAVTVQTYLDPSCTYPDDRFDIALGVCFSTNWQYSDNSISSAIALNTTDGVRISFFSGSGCQGKSVSPDSILFPAMGVCTSQARVFYTPGSGGESSGPSIGLIAGGVAGGVVLILLIVGAVWYSRKSKPVAESNVDPVRDERINKTMTLQFSQYPTEYSGQSSYSPQPVAHPTQNSSYSQPTAQPTQYSQYSHQQQTNQTQAIAPNNLTERGYAAYPRSVHGTAHGSQGNVPTRMGTTSTSFQAVDTATIASATIESAATYTASNINVVGGFNDNTVAMRTKPANVFGEINAVAIGAGNLRVNNASNLEYNNESTKVHESTFGKLVLPSLPSVWTVNDVVAWTQEIDGSSEMVAFVREQEIDGRALLLLTEGQLSFLKVGSRVKFWQKLNELREVNASVLATADELAPPPEYVA
ncbi:hypothetical protein HDU79_002021 [Rhizoclosmatium sp. JEL0117]|nr:hypothetical protein HDU79_002021 [Rhizoclosmatium sp. JEL0117]